MEERIKKIQSRANLVWLGLLTWVIGLVFLILTNSGANDILNDTSANLSDEDREKLLKAKRNAKRNFIVALIIQFVLIFIGAAANLLPQ